MQGLRAEFQLGFNQCAVSPLHVFPLRSPGAIDVESMSMFGPPERIGGAVMRGREHSTKEWVASIVFERPTVWQGLAGASKEERESAQLNRFMGDFEMGTGSTFAD